MKKSKILFLIIPLLVFISLVGIGFSSWYFGHDELSINNTNNILVYTSSAVNKGSLSIVTAPSKIVFSQGSADVNNLSDGISYYTLNSDNTTYSEDDTITLKYTILDKNDILEANKFRMYVSFSGENFSNYVKLSTAYSAANQNDGGYDYLSGFGEKYEATTKEPYGYYLYTLHLNDVIEYKSSETKPLNETIYKSLKDILETAKVVITFEAI